MAVQITTQEGAALRQAKTDAGANPIQNLTLAQAVTWINSNVTDLASAKTALVNITKVLFVLQAELNRNTTGVAEADSVNQPQGM